MQQPTCFIIRHGKSIPADEVFEAWNSNDLNRMLGVLHLKPHIIDRHFLLMGIVKLTYKERTKPEMAILCSRVAELHIGEFPNIAPALRKELSGSLPRVTTFQYYATLLAEQGKLNEAMAVCQKAISYGLHDGTKSGFEGRIQRIRKQINAGSRA